MCDKLKKNVYWIRTMMFIMLWEASCWHGFGPLVPFTGKSHCKSIQSCSVFALRYHQIPIEQKSVGRIVTILPVLLQRLLLSMPRCTETALGACGRIAY